MHVGKVPFDDKDKDQSIFQKILSLDFRWPEDVQVSIEAKDLVERLIKLNSRDRLGAGEPGSPNDLKQLQMHPYFATVDLESLQKSVVPLKIQKEIPTQDS